MNRVQLALNVEDLDAAIDFYSRMFDAEPHKTRPGYANFAIDEPPLKLVLFEGVGDPGTINHLGVELGSTDEVTATRQRLEAQGMDNRREDAVDCCYAVQDKFWVDAPDEVRFEVYTILDDQMGDEPPCGGDSAPEPVASAATSCC